MISINSIATRLIVTTTLFASLVLVIYGAINYHLQHDKIVETAQNNAKLAKNRLQMGLPIAFWNFDEALIKKLTDAEINSPFIKTIELLDPDEKTHYKNSHKEEVSGATTTFPLNYDDKGKLHLVGSVKISISQTQIDRELQNLLISSILQILCVDIVLVIALFLLSKKFVTLPLNTITRALTDIAEGDQDLTKRLHEKNSTELEKLADQFNAFVQKIETLVISISGCTEALYQTSGEVKKKSDSSNSSLHIQKEHINRLADSIANMYEDFNKIALHAQSAELIANTAQETANEVQISVQGAVGDFDKMSNQLTNTSDVIQHLEHDVNSIASIVGVIRSIADQTNLLALNAAIEAARAGEQGRGFAVVADEVRALASRTASSTVEINTMIQELQKRAQSAVEVIQASSSLSLEAMHSAHRSHDNVIQIHKSIEHISLASEKIVTAVTEQSEKSSVLHEKIQQIVEDANISTQQNAGMSIDSMELTQLADVLVNLVKQFKVSQNMLTEHKNTTGDVDLW